MHKRTVFLCKSRTRTKNDSQVSSVFSFICLFAQKENSSFVDDGICDCCDGSDEAPGFCSNNCREVGEKARQERAKKLGEVREALIIRQT